MRRLTDIAGSAPSGTATGDAGPAGYGQEVLVVDDLGVLFRGRDTQTHAVRGLSLTLAAGRVVGVAGESGSGKSATALAVMGLLPPGTQVTGSVRYRGRELLDLPEPRRRELRGRHIAMVFQETGTALNPVLRVGDQLAMAVRAHAAASKEEVRARLYQALADVRLRDPDRVLRSYPHELSGGMCQRVVLAMALSCGSNVLLADEPTTALDVSVQQEILELVKGLVDERGLAVLMISHDLAVLAELCDDLVVMYKGEVVETGPAGAVLRRPAHPYTDALLRCLPRLGGGTAFLPEMPPQTVVSETDSGCGFRERCSWRVERCETHPELTVLDIADTADTADTADAGRTARCWRTTEVRAGGRPCTE